MIIVGVVGFFSMTNFAQSSVEQYARAAGAAQVEAINQCISDYANDVTYIASDPSINDYTVSGSTSSDQMALNDELFSSMVYRGDDILNIVIMDSAGTIILDHTGAQPKGEFFFGYEGISNLAVGQIYISPIYSPNDYYEEEMFFLAKCVQDDIGNSSGYVAEVVSTSRIKEILSNSTYGTGKGYLAISDSTHTVLNFEGVASQKYDALSDMNMTDLFSSTTKAKSESQNYSISGYMGSYGAISGVSNSTWKWVCVYPADMYMSQILVPALIAIGVMAVLALVCAVLGQLVTKSIVSPINAMITNMREIKEGDYEKRIEIKTRNEFKNMSELFNGMLDDVCMSEELHRTISEISDNMLFEWDFHKETMFVSENFLEKFDIDPTEAQLANGKFLDKLMSEQEADAYKRDISTLLKNKTGHSGEYQMLTKNGTIVWFAVRALCVTDRLGEPLRVIGVVTDIDNEKKLELQLSERASYDFLSQLYNRSTFERELQSEIERSAHTKVCVMFIDVDDFKFINDRFGHSVGDEVIKYVSGCIKQRIQGSGFAGRFGGDEFVLCVTDSKQIDEIESLSLDLIDELYSGYHSELANVTINVKASIGIAFSPEHGDDGPKLIAAADEAMYFVKKNGKANYHVYQPEDSQIEDLQHTL